MTPYISRLDDRAHGGKQSLRISGAPTVNPNAVDPKTVAAEWIQVVDHLQSSRERYAGKASKRDIEWAIQNARVVLQCMQSRGNQVPRDTSMAANVKWILDQSPEAKIVLWAHNGHVTTGNNWSMGSALRKMYDDRMVVFGFSFYEGSFQAMSQSGAGLKIFTVPPAPVGSLDAALAASGHPLFALDLRQAAGPAGEWLRAAHKTRSIGAVYPEDSPYAFMSDQIVTEGYDALLFVAKATAARKNPPLPGAPAPGGVEFKAVEPAAGDTSGLVEYRDPEFDVSVKMPSGWKVSEAFRWGNQETTGRLMGPGTSEAGRLYFQMRPNPNVESELVGSPESKAAQRVQSGLKDYKIRSGSIERRTIGGRQALTCIGEFTREGIKMVEYLTWVRSEKANAQFFAMVPESEFDALRKRLDPIIATLQIP
jgi:Erythromycin esterase